MVLEAIEAHFETDSESNEISVLKSFLTPENINMKTNIPFALPVVRVGWIETTLTKHIEDIFSIIDSNYKEGEEPEYYQFVNNPKQFSEPIIKLLALSKELQVSHKEARIKLIAETLQKLRLHEETINKNTDSLSRLINR